MRYLPYAAASLQPNVIVDGTANDRTLITLSHWRQSGTPADLMADTSTAIVFNYLDRPDLHVPADVVSNNHFDEDGLVGIYALLEPDAAVPRRDLLIDVAQAGDFGVYRSRHAARIAFAISSHVDPATSPLPRPLFDRPAPQIDEGCIGRCSTSCLGCPPTSMSTDRSGARRTRRSRTRSAFSTPAGSQSTSSPSWTWPSIAAMETDGSQSWGPWGPMNPLVLAVSFSTR